VNGNLWVNGRGAPSVVLGVAGLLALPLPHSGTGDVQRGTTPLPTPIIGNWTTITDSGAPFLVVNGERWDGRANAAELTRWSRELFGAVSGPFVEYGEGERSYPLAVVREVPGFTEGTLRVGFRMMGGASDQNAGIVFGLQQSGDYYYARYNTKDGDVALWRYVNGQREVLKHGEAHVQLPLGTWQELVVAIQDRQVRVHVSGHDSVRVVHELSARPAGRVGLWVKRDAITAFRAFIAEPATSR
jgi:hypothetical protein